MPLLAAKVAAVVVVGSLVLARRTSGAALWARPDLVVVSGTADVMSNILFLLATRTGTP